MACLDMYKQNSERRAAPPPISPRISFSNDFVECSSSTNASHSQMIKHERSSSAPRESSVSSSDFEFSVTNYSMMSADELFFKGRLLPFKETCTNKTTTLRDELLAPDDDDDEEFSLRPPKNSTMKWKGFLGLRKSHIGYKKSESSAAHVTKSSQELQNEGRSTSCEDFEFRA